MGVRTGTVNSGWSQEWVSPSPKTGQRYHHADLRFIYSVHTGADRRKVTAMEEYTDDKWITRQELADRYGVPVKTPAEWASKGTGP